MNDESARSRKACTVNRRDGWDGIALDWWTNESVQANTANLGSSYDLEMSKEAPSMQVDTSERRNLDDDSSRFQVLQYPHGLYP